MTKPETTDRARDESSFTHGSRSSEEAARAPDRKSAGRKAPGRARGVSSQALLLALIAAGAAPIVGFACSTNADSNDFNTTSSSGSPAGGGNGEGGGLIFDAGFQSPVTILPENPVLKLKLPLAGQTIQFTCNDTSTGLPVDAEWTTSSLELGSISPTGLFTPNGDRSGEVVVKCKQKNSESKTQTKLRLFIHALDNIGGVTQQQIDILRGPPGLPDPSWQFLYPYDETVFPRGILAPEIHLTQGSAAGNVFSVSIVTDGVEYEGFFSTSGFNTQLQMSQDAWEALSNAAGGTKVEVRVSKISNGQKYGPIFRRWTIAKGKLHGTIYYNTYDSPLAGNGAIMRIKGNSPTAEVLIGNCTVCHSVGADGSTAAAANHSGPGGTFDLTGGFVNPPIVWQDSEMAAFAGIYPKNGEVIVIHGAPGNGNTPGTGGTYKSQLRTKNGTVILNSGIEPFYAQTPAFSLDGTMLAFLDRTPNQPNSSVFAVMKYDAVAQKFSDYDVIATPKAGRHLSWPAFTPDGKYVFVQDGTGDDLVTWSGNTGKIVAFDVQTKQPTFLAKLNGDGYMPQGSRDENKNYEPTMAPIASGGYFWMMFTSRRTYGNKLTGDSSMTKRLWVSAIDINAPPGQDSSHPAFYIAGQELTSGNSRGFWALDNCKANGSGCETGDECCDGYCNPTGDPPVFMCGPDDGSCSDESEPCMTDADCCDPGALCVGGTCVLPPPQ
jgi:hypothetical protein